MVVGGTGPGAGSLAMVAAWACLSEVARASYLREDLASAAVACTAAVASHTAVAGIVNCSDRIPSTAVVMVAGLAQEHLGRACLTSEATTDTTTASEAEADIASKLSALPDHPLKRIPAERELLDPRFSSFRQSISE